MTQHNPHPFLDKSFQVAWSQLTPDHVVDDMTFALERAREKMDAIASLADGDRNGLTFENTLHALDQCTEELDQAWSKVNHLDAVNNSKPLREAYNQVLPAVSEFYARIPLNEKLWEVIRAYSESPEVPSFNPTRKRLLEETLAEFRQQGADLSPEKKARLEAIESELASKTQKFSENVLDSTNAWELVITDKSKLKGLPAGALEAARANALQKGHGTESSPAYRFTLHAPSFIPVMKFVEDESIRKQFWEGALTIGATGEYENTPLIWEILELRHEKAELIGKPHFGDLVLERRMAGSGAAALAFVEDLFQHTKPAFDRECRELEAYKTEKTGSPGNLHPWDVSFYAERRLKEIYDFNEEDLRPYFPIDSVINGLFKLVSRIFDLRIRERPVVAVDPGSGKRTPEDAPESAIEVWHPEVRFYDLLDNNGSHLGSFYADWHPRESKRSGAWMGYLRIGERPLTGESTPHLGYIAGNLTAPTGGKPALLNHDEVLTIFHEFGHLLHLLCGNVEIKSLNGVNVPWDFVELPSQIMENWCWERKSLDFFARHYQTGEPIPDDLFHKMIRSRNDMAAGAMMRQLSFAKLDLELHLHYAKPESRPPEAERNPDALIRQWLKPYTMELSREVPTIIRRFSHLFSSPTAYAAGYYSYKWAEVLDADAFSRFKKEGVLNPETGRDFREKILSRGNSDDPTRLFRSFMGRDPDPRALLARCGLIPQPGNPVPASSS